MLKLNCVMFWQRLRPWRKTPETDQPATRMSEQDVEELLRELADAPYEELERFGRWLIEVSLGLSRRLDTRAIALVAVIAAALSTLLYRLLPHAPLLTPELGVYLLITTGFLGFAGLNALKVLHLRRHEGFTDTDWFTPKAISSTWGRHNARLLVLWRCWRAHDDSNRERASALTWGYGCFLAGSIVAVYVAFGLAAEPRATIVQMAPNTSDWVSGRHACSTDQAFADLRLQARGNVETRNSEAIRNAPRAGAEVLLRLQRPPVRNQPKRRRRGRVHARRRPDRHRGTRSHRPDRRHHDPRRQRRLRPRARQRDRRPLAGVARRPRTAVLRNHAAHGRVHPHP